MKNLSVGQVMTAPVLTVPDDLGLEQLATFFFENRVSGAPVTASSGEVVGVVSMSDIIRHSSMPNGEGEVRDTHEYYLASSGRQFTEVEVHGFHLESSSDVTVRDLMTPMVFQVAEDATVQEVAAMMLSGGIHRVLVTRQQKLTGIVTAMDMLKVVRDL